MCNKLYVFINVLTFVCCFFNTRISMNYHLISDQLQVNIVNTLSIKRYSYDIVFRKTVVYNLYNL